MIQFVLFLAILVGLAVLSSVMGSGPNTAIIRSLAYLGCGLGLAWLMARYIDRRPFAAFGFHLNRRWWTDLGSGLALGAFVITGVFLSLRWAGWVCVTGTAVTDLGLPFSMAFMVKALEHAAVGVNEELTFRGYQLKNLAEGLDGQRFAPRAAVVSAFLVSSAVFGVAHLVNAFVGDASATGLSTLNLVIGGLLLGMPNLLTGQLAIPIGLHIAWNLFEGTVYGFPVSGSSQNTHLLSLHQTGPELWTGGAFGPEAGLLCTAWMLIGCGLTLLWIRWQRGPLGLHTPLAAYTS